VSSTQARRWLVSDSRRHALHPGAKADDSPIGEVNGGDQECSGDEHRVDADAAADTLSASFPSGPYGDERGGGEEEGCCKDSE